MSLKYTILEERPVFRAAGYAARLDVGTSSANAALAAHIVREGCPLTEPQVLDVLERLPAACLAALLAGGSVHLEGLVTLAPEINPRIADAPVETARGLRLDIHAGVSWELRERFKADVRFERQGNISGVPCPLEYLDFKTGRRNEIITPGGFASVRGLGLRLNVTREDEGVFLVGEGAEELRVRSIRNNQLRELTFVNPAALPPGRYQLEVRSRSNPGGDLQRGLLPVGLCV